jgi:hypothetical protein
MLAVPQLVKMNPKCSLRAAAYKLVLYKAGSFRVKIFTLCDLSNGRALAVG